MIQESFGESQPSETVKVPEIVRLHQEVAQLKQQIEVLHNCLSYEKETADSFKKSNVWLCKQNSQLLAQVAELHTYLHPVGVAS